MGQFGNLSKNKKVKAEKDVIFSGGFGAIPSQVLTGVVEVAYFDKSKGGATSLVVHVKHAGGLFKFSLWLTGGDKKGNNNFYKDSNGDEHYLPGFIVADHIALLCAGEGIAELSEETVTKVVKVRDFELKKDVNREFEAIEELMGCEISLGVLKNIVDKKAMKEVDGKSTYVATGETREENEVVKVFSAEDNRTVSEMIDELDDAVFITEWKEAYEGKTINKAKGAANAGTASGSPADKGASEGSKKKAGGIFGKKK